MAIAVVAVAALIGVMATDSHDLAFTLGVEPQGPVTNLKPGQEACQSPIDVSAAAIAVRFNADAHAAPLAVSVRDGGPSGQRLGASAAKSARQDGDVQEAHVSGLQPGRRVAVCIHNTADVPIVLYGGSEGAARSSSLFVDGRLKKVDLTLVFQSAHGRSMLDLLPDVFGRAALFRPTWVGPWLFWLLGVLVVAAVPALLAIALTSAEKEDR